MHVGFVSQWYDPEGASAALPGVISRSLTAAGAQVDVLTGFPNYPSGKLAPGYRIRRYQREVVRGLNVHRAPLWPNHDSSGTKRAMNYLSFAAGASTTALSNFPNVDAVLVHSTPATAAIPALALKKRFGTPFVLHIQDLWPDTVLSSGLMPPRIGATAERQIHRLCDLIYRHASHIAVTSPGMARLIERRGVDSNRIHFVPNWTDEQAFTPRPKDGDLATRLNLNSPFVVMYAGNMGEYQALETLLEAARILRHRDDIRFAFVGGGVLENTIRSVVADQHLTNVILIGQQPYETMADVLALGDLQYIGLADGSLFETTLPSKLQATLAAGRPILAHLSGDALEIVLASGAGVGIRRADPTALADTITTLVARGHETLDTMGRAGRDYYLTHFSERISTALLMDLLGSAAHEGGLP